jgi:AcrR family transcriptional regulator
VSVSPAAAGARTRRQTEVFDQLVALFLAEGFLRFTVDDLALELHCSKTTLYALAQSKEQLARAVVVHFFQGAAEKVESAIKSDDNPQDQVIAYLAAVADALSPASDAFYSDLDKFPPAREVYERNTGLAARRVRQIISDGVESGAFRPVHAAFVAEVLALVMTGIGQGNLAKATGLDDAQAYRQLVDLVFSGITA